MESIIRTLAQHPPWAHLLHYTHFTLSGPHGTHERKWSLKKPRTLLQGKLLKKPGYARMCSFSPKNKTFGQEKNPQATSTAAFSSIPHSKLANSYPCLGLHRQVLLYKQGQEKLGHPACWGAVMHFGSLSLPFPKTSRLDKGKGHKQSLKKTRNYYSGQFVSISASHSGVKCLCFISQHTLSLTE